MRVEENTLNLREAARTCAKSIGMMTAGIALGAWLVGFIFEHLDMILDTLARALSLGGNFWAVLALGCGAMPVFTWSVCVMRKVEDETRTRSVLFNVALVAAAIWFAEFVLMWTRIPASSLTSYQVVAATLMHLPVVGLYFCFFRVVSP